MILLLLLASMANSGLMCANQVTTQHFDEDAPFLQPENLPYTSALLPPPYSGLSAQHYQAPPSYSGLSAQHYQAPPSYSGLSAQNSQDPPQYQVYSQQNLHQDNHTLQTQTRPNLRQTVIYRSTIQQPPQSRGVSRECIWDARILGVGIGLCACIPSIVAFGLILLMWEANKIHP